jgi:hypothetical protein
MLQNSEDTVVTDIKENSNELLLALQQILQNYLKERPARSVNGLSKKCVVSESTLRRILSGQIKTMPTATTVLDILTTISKEKNIQNILKLYPGTIANYLETNLPQSENVLTEYCQELNQVLKDSSTYIIYKLASNSMGLRREKIIELFGLHGIACADVLVENKYLSLTDNIYRSQIENFTLHHDTFVQKFKAVADFIKIQKNIEREHLNPLLVNYSESVSAEAYKEIVSLQKRTLKKIRDIMSAKDSQGQIPLFLLLAIDTLDTKSANEIEHT